MAAYTLPREAFDLLVEAFGEKRKAEIFAKAMEAAINAIQENAKEEIVEKKEMMKIQIKEELRNELVTRELFESLRKEMNERFNVVEEKFKVVEEKFKSLNFKLNIFLAIALIALTFANPTFVAIIQRLFQP
jgi:hypothetical protein